MRIALFVEGSVPHGSRDHCARLWNERLLPALERAPVDHVIPFSKGAISRMLGRSRSPAGSSLDGRILDVRNQYGLNPSRDAIVIAWDLEPIDPLQTRCAWREKVELYEALAASTLLREHADAWACSAAQRAAALRVLAGRPPRGVNHSRVTPGSVLGLCMEPMFEALLTRDGRAIRRALGLAEDPPGWPTGWGPGERDPSRRLLGPAIAAIRRLRPKPEVCRRTIREPWDNAKDEWGEYLLRHLLADPKEAANIREHAIARRLAYLLPPRSQL